MNRLCHFQPCGPVTGCDVPPVGGWGLWPTFRHTESIKETSEMTQTPGPAADLIEHAAGIIVAAMKEPHTAPYHWAGALWEAGMLQPPGRGTVGADDGQSPPRPELTR